MYWLKWAVLIATQFDLLVAEGLKIRQALVDAVHAVDSPDAYYTLVIRVEGRIPLRSEALRLKKLSSQLDDSPLRVTFQGFQGQENNFDVLEQNISQRVYSMQIPVSQGAAICFKVGFEAEPGVEDQLYFRSIFEASSRLHSGEEFLIPRPQAQQSTECVLFTENVRVVGISIFPVVDTEANTQGTGSYRGTVEVVGRYPRCKIFGNPMSCLEFSKQFTDLKCGWTELEENKNEGLIGRCHDDFTSNNVQLWCNTVCERLDTYTVVETFEGKYQCVRDSEETCTSRRLRKNVDGIASAIIELSCELNGNSDPNAPFNEEICLKDHASKLDWNTCTNTYILPANTRRRPCTQNDTITVGEGPGTTHVYGVPTVEECNYQCAREQGCTNWVFDFENQLCTLKQNRFDPILQDVVAAVRLPRAGFTSGILCHDPSRNINMTEYWAHQACLFSCEQADGWGKCWDALGKALPNQPSTCMGLAYGCHWCQEEQLINLHREGEGAPIPDNLTDVRLRRECAGECDESVHWNKCYDSLGYPVGNPPLVCRYIWIRCNSCREKLSQLELASGDETVASPFQTAQRGAFEFHYGDMYATVDPENIRDADNTGIARDLTIEGLDAFDPVSSVSTIEQCRSICHKYKACVFFVFSPSEGSCALKTGAPARARKSKIGSFLGTKYKGITCGSRIHTQMQNFGLSLEDARVKIIRRFPACSNVCKLYTEIDSENQATQVLQIQTRMRAPPTIQEIFDAALPSRTGNRPLSVKAVFVFSAFGSIFPRGRYSLRIYVLEQGTYGLLMNATPRRRMWTGAWVPLVYSPLFEAALRAGGADYRNLYWIYGTGRVVNCFGDLVWNFVIPKGDFNGEDRDYLSDEAGLRAGIVKMVDFASYGTSAFELGVCRRLLPRCRKANPTRLLQTQGGTEGCMVCCQHSPLLDKLPPAHKSCGECRKEGQDDPMPGFPILHPIFSPLCLEQPIPVPTPEPPKPRCIRVPRHLKFLNHVFKKDSILCREGTLLKLVHLINTVGMAGAAGCLAADASAVVICETSTAGLGTPVCVAGAVGIAEVCAALSGTSAVATIADLGRAIGCRAFSGECIKIV
mmetsp:Transcript_41776/g.67083  ORF Transcript_41776/g.67083 Transcript_41776/m.67083 type:complete len:1090 (-) Transcript_41776:76-3345(-)